jgi:hypothetical protein
MALTSFELGRLKIIAHVREELGRAGVACVIRAMPDTIPD